MTPSEVRARFPSDPASASLARKLVDRTLQDWSCSHLAEAASLLVSELVANAVLHAGTSIHVAVLRLGGRLRVEVHDGSARLPTRKHYSKMSTTGRGLLLVERLSDDWGTEATPTGKVVWFELDREGAQRDAGLAMVDFGEFDFDFHELAASPSERRTDDDDHNNSERRGAANGGPRLRVLQRSEP